jgi:hypothetical protein
MSDEITLSELRRFADNLRHELKLLQTTVAHDHSLSNSAREALTERLLILQADVQDHEHRLRNVHDEVIRTKSLLSIWQAAQLVITLIASSIAAYLGAAR